ncbi:MAG TPA: enoyl-CoA hydratase [Clostridiaceae bacterium]|nr:enoyl-CoA hydratase [Clostridiaceae bacterium]
MSKEKVLTSLEDGILLVTLNREEKRNAIDPDTAQQLEAIFNDAEKNDEVRVIVLTGTGNRSFCAGEDLSVFSDSGESQTTVEHGFAGITERFSSKPYICAVNGTAVAGGLEIALSCDIIVASENARFGLSEVRVGLLATSGGLVRLPNLVPPKIAAEMALTGQLINAEKAEKIGLVNYVVAEDAVLEKALEIAKTIKKNAPISLRLTKEILRLSGQVSFEDAMKYSSLCWDYIEKTEDAQEGPNAFLEKREPQWKNR